MFSPNCLPTAPSVSRPSYSSASHKIARSVGACNVADFARHVLYCEQSDAFVLVFCFCNTNADELKSIQAGGIDFITKPYDTLILLEKIKRALQLSNPNNFRELVKKDCTLDLHLSILKYQEKSIELTRNEFRILYYFFMNEDKIISKEELLDKLWNDKYYLDENILLVNMTRLKKKMKEIGIVHLLENIRGKGWKL